MADSESTRPRSILADLQSSDQDRIQSALESLTDELTAYARARLGQRRHQVNCQAESVVQSVLVRELGKGVSGFANEEHLRAHVMKATKNKIIDRIRGPKGRTGQASQFGEEGLSDPAVDGDSVNTRIFESDRVDWLGEVLTAGLDGVDQEIIRRAVIGDDETSEVARHVNLTPAAIRQRLTRLRPGLRKRLLEPVRSEVSADEWAVINACLVERIDPKLISDLLGLSPERIEEILEEVMRDRLVPAIGNAGLVTLGRLLGRPRDVSPSEGDARRNADGGDR